MLKLVVVALFLLSVVSSKDFGHGKAVEFNKKNEKKILDHPLSIHHLMFVNKRESYYNSVKKAAQAVAKKYPGKALHVLVPHTQQGLLQYFNLKPKDLPTTILVDQSSGVKKWRYPEKEITETGLMKFEGTFFKDRKKLKRYVLSAKPPRRNKGPVKVIVGDTFESEIMESEDDVLLFIYSPSCPHCKKLHAPFKKLGQRVSKIKGIKIAKLDGTTNDVDHPKIDITGFPYIAFFPSGSKDNPNLRPPTVENTDTAVKWLAKRAKNKSAKAKLKEMAGALGGSDDDDAGGDDDDEDASGGDEQPPEERGTFDDPPEDDSPPQPEQPSQGDMDDLSRHVQDIERLAQEASGANMATRVKNLLKSVELTMQQIQAIARKVGVELDAPAGGADGPAQNVHIKDEL